MCVITMTQVHIKVQLQVHVHIKVQLQVHSNFISSQLQLNCNQHHAVLHVH